MERDHEAVERQLSVLFRRSRSMSRTFAARVHPDLDTATYAMLLLLDEAGPMRGGDIGAHFGLDKSTVSRQLAKLINLGLAERLPDPTDGRAQLVRITGGGHEQLVRLRTERRRELGRVLDHWDPTDVAQFARLLELFNESMR